VLERVCLFLHLHGTGKSRPFLCDLMPTGTVARMAASAASLFWKRRKSFWVAALLTLAADQWTKILLSSLQKPLIVIPRLLWFVSQRSNPRGVFGMGPNQPVFYLVATVLGVLIMLYFLANSDETRWRPNVALGLICGGALGNLVDRLAFGAVRDFIKMALWPFAYNVADAAICVGVGILLMEAFLHGTERPDTEASGRANA